MKRLVLALILVAVLTLALATPVLAKEPPDEKSMPQKGIQGLINACWAMSLNPPSLVKLNPGLSLPNTSVKEWTNYMLIGLGPPIAWGYWVK